MGGTVSGGLKTAAKLRQHYGLNYYGVIGRKGGSVSRGGGFAFQGVGTDGLTGRERASIAGAKGGAISKCRPPESVEDYHTPKWTARFSKLFDE